MLCLLMPLQAAEGSLFGIGSDSIKTKTYADSGSAVENDTYNEWVIEGFGDGWENGTVAHNVLNPQVLQREHNGVMFDYLSYGTPGGNDVTILQKNFAQPLNLSGYDISALAFSVWFYIEDVEAITGGAGAGQFEISSSGIPDNGEVGWNVSRTGAGSHVRLKSGWNEFILPFTGGVMTGSPLNLASINFFRFFLFTQDSANLGVYGAKIIYAPLKTFSEDFAGADSADNWTSENAAVTHESGALKIDAAAGRSVIGIERYTSGIQLKQFKLTAEIKADNVSNIESIKLKLGFGLTAAG